VNFSYIGKEPGEGSDGPRVSGSLFEPSHLPNRRGRSDITILAQWHVLALLAWSFHIILYACVKDAADRAWAPAAVVAVREGEVTNRCALRAFVRIEVEWFTFQRAAGAVRVDEGTLGVDEDDDDGGVHGLW